MRAGLLLCGPLIRTFGWPSVFYVFAVLGLAWAVLWPLCEPERIDEAMRREAAAEEAGFARLRMADGTDAGASRSTDDGEQAPAKSGVRGAAALSMAVGEADLHVRVLAACCPRDRVPHRRQTRRRRRQLQAPPRACVFFPMRPCTSPHARAWRAQGVPYGKFLRSKAVWALICAHFCFNWGYYTLLAWLPSYFDLAVGLPVDQSSYLTLIPYLSMVRCSRGNPLCSRLPLGASHAHVIILPVDIGIRHRVARPFAHGHLEWIRDVLCPMTSQGAVCGGDK